MREYTCHNYPDARWWGDNFLFVFWAAYRLRAVDIWGVGYTETLPTSSSEFCFLEDTRQTAAPDLLSNGYERILVSHKWIYQG